MEDKNQGTRVPFAVDPTPASPMPGNVSMPVQSASNTQPEPAMPLAPPPRTPPTSAVQARRQRRWIIIGITVLGLLALAGVIWFVRSAIPQETPGQPDPSSRFNLIDLPLDDLAEIGDITTIDTHTLTINGSLQVNSAFIISPSAQPSAATAGQIYYDQTSNQLAYYNGSEFVPVASGDGVVQSLGGLSGELTLGPGLAGVGGLLSNTGIINIASNSANLAVTNDGAGNVTLTSTAGTVSSPGGTVGVVPLFTDSQNIANSLLSQSANGMTIAGSLSLQAAGTTSLSLAHAASGVTGQIFNDGNLHITGGQNNVWIDSGGVGTIFLNAANGNPVAINQATIPAFPLEVNGDINITSGHAYRIGGTVICTIAGCTGAGGGGVSSLDGLSGALTIANSTGAGTTITIDDASTAQKGIAQFNSTNFSAAGGVVNTIQNINSGASPTFVGLTLTGDAAVNGGDITSSGALNITPGGALTVGVGGQALSLQGNASTAITATGGGFTTTVNFTGTPTGAVTYQFDRAAAAGTYEICSTAGNCASAGGGVTTGGGTPNVLAKFSGAQAITDSTISDNGTTVSTTVDLAVQGGSVEIGTTAQVATLLLHDGSGQTTTLQAGNSAGNLTFILPTNTGSANQCLKQSGGGNQLIWDDCDGGGGGSSGTLQSAYNNSTSPEIVVDATRGALTVRDTAGGIGSNLLEIQNNAGSTTYFAVTASGISVTGTTTSTGNINSSGGALQTNGTTRIDNSGNASNIGNITLSGTITGGTTYSGSGNINTTGGGLQTNSVTRVDNSGNLININDATIGGVLTANGNVALGNATTDTLAFNATVQGASPLIFEGGAADANQLTLQIAALTGDRTITLPDETGVVCLQSSANCGFVTGSGQAFVQGGNSFGSTATLGTNDANALEFETSGATRITIAANGANVTLASNTDLLLQGATAYISNSQTQSGSEAFGLNASLSGTNALAVGNGAVSAASGVAVGNGADASGNGIAIGQGSNANSSSTAIGQGANAGSTDSIALGRGATTTASNQLVIGDGQSATNYINDVYIGNGVTDATPQGFTLNATGGNGANIAGAAINIAGGKGTGTGAGGSVNFQIAQPAVGSGSSLNSLSTVGSFSGTNGAFTLQNAADSTTAFRVLNQAGTTSVLSVDTSTPRVVINGTGTNGIGGTLTFGSGSHTPSIQRSDDPSWFGEDVLTITAAGLEVVSTSGGSDPFLQMDNFNGRFTFRMANDPFGHFQFLDSTSDWLFDINGQNGSGEVSFKNRVDSNLAFRVLNGSGIPLFQIDTSNNLIYVGNPTADSTGALLVLDTKNDAGDPTGVDGGMYYNSSSDTFRCYEKDVWSECVGAPKPNTGRTTNLVANGSTATWTGYGDALTNTNNGTSGGSVSTNLVPSVFNDTGAVSGNVAGVSGNAIYNTDRLVYQTHMDILGGTTSIRTWAGLTNQTIATMGASATPAGEYAAFRYDTSAGDATWQCVTRDGSSSTVVNSAVSIAADQRFEIVVDTSRAVFKINGQIVCNITTTLPSAFLRVVNSITTLTTVSKSLYIGWVYIEFYY